ncbi:VOC family protein [Lapillicoccus sp.]|uniref:VOC family protein n=1 Tax=Lapillicoccus sp. TaxID=1909287 RepID=UPI003983B5C8
MTAIRWTQLFLDRPRQQVDAAAAFWASVTDSDLSPWRDAHTFATFEPRAGASYLRVHAVVDGGGGAHLDLEVDDLRAGTERAVGLGARVVGQDVVEQDDGLVVLRSPAGLGFCLVPHRGASERPPPVGHPTTRVDQVCLDLPAAVHDLEAAFWTRLTGWERHRGRLPEFELLAPPAGMPVRLLLQRLTGGDRAGAHVDLATTDRVATRAQHAALGARELAVHEHWSVMRDPAGGVYCLTDRDPLTGSLPPAAASLPPA